MASNIRNRREQGGSTWSVSGDLNVESSGVVDVQSGGSVQVASGGYVAVSSGGQIGMPVVGSTSTDAPIPNYGLCIIRSTAAVAGDIREVAQPTRAGLELNLVSLCAHSGVNVCVASMTSLADCTISSTGATKTIWELVKGSSQSARMVSANTSQWYVIGLMEGVCSSSGSSG